MTLRQRNVLGGVASGFALGAGIVLSWIGTGSVLFNALAAGFGAAGVFMNIALAFTQED